MRRRCTEGRCSRGAIRLNIGERLPRLPGIASEHLPRRVMKRTREALVGFAGATSLPRTGVIGDSKWRQRR